jgi:hypothetical protein
MLQESPRASAVEQHVDDAISVHTDVCDGSPPHWFSDSLYRIVTPKAELMIVDITSQTKFYSCEFVVARLMNPLYLEASLYRHAIGL